MHRKPGVSSGRPGGSAAAAPGSFDAVHNARPEIRPGNGAPAAPCALAACGGAANDQVVARLTMNAAARPKLISTV